MDAGDVFELPRTLLVGVLRALWWLGWEFMIETVGWSIGWCALRVLTVGRFPRERLSGQDDASGPVQCLVESVGLLCLAALLWRLTGEWP
ncbi:hypothetical protein [Denitromonas iodatirespirans]|uniref:Uncharacterized protein n=1 Tax=Denitromonas iodatirespirans TaxID=2795389 RepID=A0A944D4A6_DENI1|nr:hypothetical protein [Denitromonas iodatirespirans]MBT0959585.1 hypothetical protein [Denitromonas iodatirespirans]